MSRNQMTLVGCLAICCAALLGSVSLAEERPLSKGPKRVITLSTAEVRGSRLPTASLNASSPNDVMAGCAASRVLPVRVENLSAAEAGGLQDAFAKILREHPTERNLRTVLDLLRVDQSDNEAQMFVVHEWIKQSAAAAQPRSRRAVIAFTNQPTQNQVMLSLSFRSDAFPHTLAENTEVWGWDEPAGVFNFYEFSSEAGEWALVGSSPRPNDPPERLAGNRCLGCHINGVPIMKELRLPWQNWESNRSPNAYLHPGTSESWPVAATLPVQIQEASRLEALLKPLIARFNQKRIAALTTPDPAGNPNIGQVPKLLRHLFVTTEFNLAAAREPSGRSPFAASTADPVLKIGIPSSFFLNSTLIGGETVGPSLGGLSIVEARRFQEIALAPVSQYAALVNESKLGFASEQAGVFARRPGFDAEFAWLTPERSFVDDHLVNELIRRRIVTPQFVAATLLVDLRTPVFSAPLEQIFATPDLFPTGFQIPATLPSNHRDHPLTAHVLGKLASINPDPDSPLGKWRGFLRLDSSVDELKTQIAAYLDEVQADFPANGTVNAQKLKALFNRLIERRIALLKDVALSELDETREQTPVNGFRRSQALLPHP